VGTCEEGVASLKAAKTPNRMTGGHPATVYGSKEAFETSQKRRRCKHLALYLDRFDEATQKQVLDGCKQELDDLKIATKAGAYTRPLFSST
jgi:hypothetical protein